MAEKVNGRLLFDLQKIDVKPHIVHDYLSPENFATLKDEVLRAIATFPYDSHIGRWAGSLTIPEKVNEELLSRIRTICKRDDIVPAYNYLVKYQIKDGCIPHLWEHTDQNGSHISVNITIAKSVSWKLIVERQVFELSENSAVVFLGQEHDHARPAFPTDNPDDYVIQFFLEYATPDHWIITKKGGLPEYGRDGDVRFFNRHRYFPLPDPPTPNTKCHEERTDAYARVLAFYEEVNAASGAIPEVEKVEYEITESEPLFPGLRSYQIDPEASELFWGLTVNACYKQWGTATYGARDAQVGDEMRFQNFFLTEKHKSCHPVDPMTRLAYGMFDLFDDVITLYTKNYALRKLVPESYMPHEENRITLLRSGVGKGFSMHADEQTDRPRVVTAIAYLNDSYSERNNSFTGGEIVFDQIGVTVAPKAGQVLVFPSNYLFSHSVNNVTSGVRYAATRFYVYE